MVGIQLASPLLAAGVSATVARRPLVVMTTKNGPFGERPLLFEPGIGRLRRYFLERAATVVVQTQAGATEVADWVESSRITVIPNPVNLVPAPPLTGRPSAAFAGRFSQEKDLVLLLHAWADLVGRRLDACLTLIGSGGGYRSVEKELRALVAADNRLARSVAFTGWVPDALPLIGGADVFAFPSMSEGMSNALLEACALGRVVVASDIPANVEVLGRDYPLLFGAGSRQELSAALERALFDAGERTAARAEVLRRVQAHAPETYASEVERVISQVENRARR